MSLPAALVVNPNGGLLAKLDACLREAFGNAIKYTVYSRPFEDGHPRMRPHNLGAFPNFGLVMIDVTGWIGSRSAEDVILGEPLPGWLEEDLLELLGDALVLIVTPMHAMQGVAALARGMAANPHLIVVDDLPAGGGQPPVSRLLRSIWDNWMSDSKGRHEGTGRGSVRARRSSYHRILNIFDPNGM
jgi:hypothetical protein